MVLAVRRASRAFGVAGIAGLILAMFGVGLVLTSPLAGAAPPPAAITDYTGYAADLVAGCTTPGTGFATGQQYYVQHSASNGGALEGPRSSMRDWEGPPAGLTAILPGDTVIMTWTGFAQANCINEGVSLSVKAAPSLVFDPTVNQTLYGGWGYCGPEGDACTTTNGVYSLQVTIPNDACFFQLDAVIGKPLGIVGPNGSFYGSSNRNNYPHLGRGASGASDDGSGDPGPTRLIDAFNGGTACQVTTTTQPTTTTIPETTTTVPETTTTIPETTTTVPETTTTVPETTTTIPQTTTTIPQTTTTLATTTTGATTTQATTTTAATTTVGTTTSAPTTQATTTVTVAGTVVTPGQGTGGQQLPRTGRDPWSAIHLGVALMIVGGTLMLWGRRRQVV